MHACSRLDSTIASHRHSHNGKLRLGTHGEAGQLRHSYMQHRLCRHRRKRPASYGQVPTAKRAKCYKAICSTAFAGIGSAQAASKLRPGTHGQAGQLRSAAPALPASAQAASKLRLGTDGQAGQMRQSYLQHCLCRHRIGTSGKQATARHPRRSGPIATKLSAAPALPASPYKLLKSYLVQQSLQ